MAWPSSRAPSSPNKAWFNWALEPPTQELGPKYAAHQASTLPEALDTTRIHRIAGLTGRRTAFVTTCPCRTPHHTIADGGLIGGGHILMLGEVSLAHHGLFFGDELSDRSCTHAVQRSG
jgi:magnesium chelatase subunit ChlI-like protein